MNGAGWRPPPSWRHIETIDGHAAGEPLRVIVAGLDPIPGATMVDKRRYAREHLEGVRRGLLFEPRRHADMYGAITTEPVAPDGDQGVLFLHNEGWSTMCGHGIIALVTVILETGMMGPRELVRIDAPAGRIVARPRGGPARVTSVAFENVPSFVVALDEHVEVPGIGRVRYDIAFGGAFYAFVEAADVGVGLTPEHFRALIGVSSRIKRALMKSREVRHPFEPELSFLYGTVLTGPALGAGATSRNVCVFAEGEVDRSPTGTGVSARLAIERARGRLGLGESFVVESIIDTRFVGRIASTTRFGPYDAVIPEVEGGAWITGRSEFVFAPDDPLADGFILR